MKKTYALLPQNPATATKIAEWLVETKKPFCIGVMVATKRPCIHVQLDGMDRLLCRLKFGDIPYVNNGEYFVIRKVV